MDWFPHPLPQLHLCLSHIIHQQPIQDIHLKMRSKVFHPHHFPTVPRDSQQTRQCWVLIQPKQSFSAASSQKRSSFRIFRLWVAISQENLLSFHPHQQHLSRREQCLDRQPDNFLFNNHSAMVHKEWCLHHSLCLDFLHLLFRLVLFVLISSWLLSKQINLIKTLKTVGVFDMTRCQEVLHT